MELLHQKLAAAQHDDSRWIAKLIVDIPTPPSLLAFIPVSKSDLFTKTASINTTTTTDIIPFVSNPPVAMVTVLERHLHYPLGVSFCFEGFNGLQDSKRLVAYLIDKASTSDGTQLRVGINREYVHPKNKS